MSNNNASVIEGASILLVEDNGPLTRNLAFLLQVAGLKVTTACIGAEALRLLKRESFDVALVDLDMPGEDGTELLRRIRMDAGRINALPIIAISRNYALPDLMRALDLGATDYLPKPFGIEDVLNVITEALEASKEWRLAG